MKLPTLEQQVCSLEQSKELWELGARTFGLYAWANANGYWDGDGDFVIEFDESFNILDENAAEFVGNEWKDTEHLEGKELVMYPALTLSELLHISPQSYTFTYVLDGFLVADEIGDNCRSCMNPVSGVADLLIELLFKTNPK